MVKGVVYCGPSLRWVTLNEINALRAAWHTQNDVPAIAGTLCAHHYSELEYFDDIYDILNGPPPLLGGYFVLACSIAKLCLITNPIAPERNSKFMAKYYP